VFSQSQAWAETGAAEIVESKPMKLNYHLHYHVVIVGMPPSNHHHLLNLDHLRHRSMTTIPTSAEITPFNNTDIVYSSHNSIDRISNTIKMTESSPTSSLRHHKRYPFASSSKSHNDSSKASFALSAKRFRKSSSGIRM
jgi:hypothetical protein